MKIYHLEFREGMNPTSSAEDKHFFFGSIAAIYDQFTADEVGCSAERLYNIGVAKNITYFGRKCIIREGHVSRKVTRRGTVNRMLESGPCVVLARVLGVDAALLARPMAMVMSRGVLCAQDVLQFTSLGAPLLTAAQYVMKLSDKGVEARLREGIPASIFWNMMLALEESYKPAYDVLHAEDLMKQVKALAKNSPSKPPTTKPK